MSSARPRPARAPARRTSSLKAVSSCVGTSSASSADLLPRGASRSPSRRPSSSKTGARRSTSALPAALVASSCCCPTAERSRDRHTMTDGEGRSLILDGPIGHALLRLSIPIILGNLLQTAYQLTDAFWVGRLGASAVAAVAVNLPVTFLVVVQSVVLINLIIGRSEEHTSELQSLMRISYAVFCLKKKK